MRDVLKLYVTHDTYIASMAALRIAIDTLPVGDTSREEFEAALFGLRDSFHTFIRADFTERHRGNEIPALLRPQA